MVHHGFNDQVFGGQSSFFLQTSGWCKYHHHRYQNGIVHHNIFYQLSRSRASLLCQTRVFHGKIVNGDMLAGAWCVSPCRGVFSGHPVYQNIFTLENTDRIGTVVFDVFKILYRFSFGELTDIIGEDRWVLFLKNTFYHWQKPRRHIFHCAFHWLSVWLSRAAASSKTVAVHDLRPKAMVLEVFGCNRRLASPPHPPP